MEHKKRGGLEGLKDKLQARRNTILYVLAVSALFFALAGWALLPDRVALRYSNGELTNYVDKNSALLVHLAISLGLGGMFWKWPREIVYLIGSALGVALSLSVLLTNLGLV